MNYCENIEFPVICGCVWIVCWVIGAGVIYGGCALLSMIGYYIAKLVFPGMKITEIHCSMKKNIDACESTLVDLVEEFARLDLHMMTSLEEIKVYEARDINCGRMTKSAALELLKKNFQIKHAKTIVERKLDEVMYQLTNMQQALGAMDDTLLEISHKLQSIRQPPEQEQEQEEEQEVQEQEQEQDQEQEEDQEEVQEAILLD